MLHCHKNTKKYSFIYLNESPDKASTGPSAKVGTGEGAFSEADFYNLVQDAVDSCRRQTNDAASAPPAEDDEGQGAPPERNDDNFGPVDIFSAQGMEKKDPGWKEKQDQKKADSKKAKESDAKPDRTPEEKKQHQEQMKSIEESLKFITPSETDKTYVKNIRANADRMTADQAKDYAYILNVVGGESDISLSVIEKVASIPPDSVKIYAKAIRENENYTVTDILQMNNPSTLGTAKLQKRVEQAEQKEKGKALAEKRQEQAENQKSKEQQRRVQERKKVREKGYEEEIFKIELTRHDKKAIKSKTKEIKRQLKSEAEKRTKTPADKKLYKGIIRRSFKDTVRNPEKLGDKLRKSGKLRKGESLEERGTVSTLKHLTQLKKAQEAYSKLPPQDQAENKEYAEYLDEEIEQEKGRLENQSHLPEESPPYSPHGHPSI